MNSLVTLSGMRVFIVEDEALVSMMLEDFLDDIGCRVVAVSARLDDAIGKAKSIPMDVAVLDVNLAGEQSYPVADILRARSIPFVFATEYGITGVSAELQDTPVLVKPFGRMQLAEALRMVCVLSQR